MTRTRTLNLLAAAIAALVIALATGGLVAPAGV